MQRNILMIGGSHGIGKAIAELLTEDVDLYIASRSKEGLEDVSHTHIEFDATTQELDVGRLPETLHGFVYCPGSINLKPFKMMGMESFEQDMHLNFFAMVKVLKEILPKMAKNSSIVLFSTVAVAQGMPFHTSIAASKGALEGFGRSLAAEYAPDLRVNIIAPSLVDTPLAERLLNKEEKRQKMAERHPLKRVGKADDIAKMAAFLLGGESSWITGQVFRVDGGLSRLDVH